MLDTVRLRLTLWYSLVLAFVLIFLAILTYFLYWRNIARRTDSDLTQLAQAFITTFRAELNDQQGLEPAKAAAREAMLEHRFRGTCFVITDSTGEVLQSSLALPSTASSSELPTENFFKSDSFRKITSGSTEEKPQTISGERGRYRALVLPLVAAGQNYSLVALQSLHFQKEMLEDIRNTFLWAIPIAVLFASIGGYFLARQSLAPVTAMAMQAKRMGAADLKKRLWVANERDELGQLAQAINQLLGRLEESFEQQRRFMADASHELRTPVAILRGETEVTLSQPERTSQEYREALSILGQESQRLAKIVEDLFILARADAGQYPLTFREAYLDEIASEALLRARSLALSRTIALKSAIEPDLPIFADEGLLGRMLINLLDNAIKYSTAGSTVTLSCRRDDTHYVLCVSDNGPGIPSDLQPRLFERFFRADKARSRSEGETGGAGLGLAIARWIVEAHEGQLRLTHSDSSGTSFTATLPTGPPDKRIS